MVGNDLAMKQLRVFKYKMAQGIQIIYKSSIYTDHMLSVLSIVFLSFWGHLETIRKETPTEKPPSCDSIHLRTEFLLQPLLRLAWNPTFENGGVYPPSHPKNSDYKQISLIFLKKNKDTPHVEWFWLTSKTCLAFFDLLFSSALTLDGVFFSCQIEVNGKNNTMYCSSLYHIYHSAIVEEKLNLCISAAKLLQAHDLTHITAQQSHHVWRAPRKTQVTSRRWSHITDIIFWKNSLRAPMNPANRIFIFFSVQIKKSLRARSSYAIFERNVCIIHSRLHWGAGFDRLVIYASIMAIYIGALVLTGGKLRINHSRLHWGAGFDRLIVYASIISVYIGAVALKGRKLCMN